MNNKKPDIKVCISTYLDIETGIDYWSVNWSFIYDGKTYGHYMLSTKNRYSQSECIKNSIEPILQQAEDIYEMLVEQKKMNQ